VTVDSRLARQDQTDKFGPAPIPRVGFAGPASLKAGLPQVPQNSCPVPACCSQMEVALKTARCRDRARDDLEPSIQVMVQLVRIHVLSQLVAHAIGQKSDAKLAEDRRHIAELVALALIV
jgi:hypothetical protein